MIKDEILSRIQKKFPLVPKPFEAIANELGMSEDEVLNAIFFVHEQVQPLIDMQKDLMGELGKEKRVVDPIEVDAELQDMDGDYLRPQRAQALYWSGIIESEQGNKDIGIKHLRESLTLWETVPVSKKQQETLQNMLKQE